MAEDAHVKGGAERLLVYQLAVELHERVGPVVHSARQCGLHDIASQLDRCAASVALNIAEGAAEYSNREKVRFYRMARRSAAEARSALTLLLRDGILTTATIQPFRTRILRLLILLTRLIRSVESRPGP